MVILLVYAGNKSPVEWSKTNTPFNLSSLSSIQPHSLPPWDGQFLHPAPPNRLHLRKANRKKPPVLTWATYNLHTIQCTRRYSCPQKRRQNPLKLPQYYPVPQKGEFMVQIERALHGKPPKAPLLTPLPRLRPVPHPARNQLE